VTAKIYKDSQLVYPPFGPRYNCRMFRTLNVAVLSWLLRCLKRFRKKEANGKT